MMPLNTLNDLLISQLNELHATEHHGAEVYHELSRSAANPQLAEMLGRCADTSREHIKRLRDVFAKLALSPRPWHRAESEGARGLCEDCMRLITVSKAEPHVRDAAIIAVAQHLIHDQIAGYGCARTWSGLLGHDKLPPLLQASLRDERDADVELTRLADVLNRSALAHALS